ncbi:hypothetical protein [Neolewinella litorea]|uniref:Helix-hairpin-helix domain-containing protein n=1 Tax=Neolewinella litorea TaxID=2562452 RepID=A0A4S4NLJ1_9BACT|nr:hypothetical protein [Neolewinella litorea]THH39825.1 hypothetical protein E4021_09435 [Neolewinella litorea]
MASLKKELRAVLARFEAAQEAFIEGTQSQKKNKKKIKSSKAKIKSLEQKVASLEQQLQVIQRQQDMVVDSTAAPLETTPKPSTPKRSGGRRGGKKKDAQSSTSDNTTRATAAEMAEAVSDAPDSVSEAAAEKTTPKPRRGRPRKTTGAAKSARKSGSATKRKSTGRRGRPSTKGPESELTKISGVGVTMAKRFEEAGVTSIEQFANLSDDDMKDVLQKCGPRYRNADSDRMESYRESARQAMQE